MSVFYGPNIVAEALELVTSGQPLNLVYNGPTSVTITKVGTNSWDTQAYSPVPYTAPCTIEFNKNAGVGDNGVSYTMVGWNADPTSNASYDTIDWAAYPFMTSGYQVYHNATQILPGLSWDQAKKFYIVYATDGYIRHYNGTTLLYSVNKGTSGTVYFDSSFYSGNDFGSLKNLRIIKRAWNGTCYVI